MKQQKRKGFTLVELLIVIAILAILATVSIIGYTQFINKARISNDTALVKQINDLLIADEAINGKPATMGQAMEIVGQGFNIVNLTPTTQGYNFVYDMSVNRFALVDKDNKLVYGAGELTKDPTQIWTIVEDASIFEHNDYDKAYEASNSLYIPKDIVESSSEHVVTLYLSKLVGVEIEKGCSLNTLDITDRPDSAPTTPVKPAVIAGNIETVQMDAPYGEVEHHGVSSDVSIFALKDDSWHEYGTVGTVKIQDGHIVIENGANVNAVEASDILDSSEYTSGTVAITIQPGVNVSVVAASKNITLTVQTGATCNTIAKIGEVEIKGEGFEATEIKQVDDVDDIEIMAKFGGGLGTENDPFLISTEEHFKALEEVRGEVYFRFTNDIVMNIENGSVVDEGAKPLAAVKGDATVYLDLGGFKLSATTSAADLVQIPYFIQVGRGELTIQNGTIDCSLGTNPCGGIYVDSYSATLNICDGTKIIGGHEAILVNSGTANIKGGFFDLTDYCKATDKDGEMKGHLVNAIDEQYADDSANITITGGTFVEFNPADNPEGDGTSYVADGHTVESEDHNGETWYVVK